MLYSYMICICIYTCVICIHALEPLVAAHVGYAHSSAFQLTMTSNHGASVMLCSAINLDSAAFRNDGNVKREKFYIVIFSTNGRAKKM